ncbi:DUF3800 domain-containing protein [Bacillus haynesii]|uniref:DUF3800 domain-containing protein n=1 Tax=Bacillus haynesii TaxID=1925021 RepID=A0AA90JE72_9BACI|nr:DUF3800 domain-containing protein [Bacillus haynesii]MCY7791634.1 DUF3800 domain-containing protein [Bacillus haynesii]MCY9225770.1 DUF3800 domain-containing protein [Bacillus haynesii]MCY9279240.1 DUF3800 domain-containing protein [Bacillus haynesii]MCY9392325.1 DUF3800 domain-containing protein [Bacillus haynesii]
MFNIYCDESCHLENDNQKAMVLGAIRIHRDRVKIASDHIKAIKLKHGLSRSAEIKWTKVSPAKYEFYAELIDYFFRDSDMNFRGLVIPNKKNLNHEVFDQTHDEWYYKMYYFMLKPVIAQIDTHIYIDIKDTNGAKKIHKLREYLSRSIYDFSQVNITKAQLIRSEESQILQLVDLIIGAIGYENRDLYGSQAKLRLVELIKRKSGSNLRTKSSLFAEKFNLFVWDPQ